METIYPQAASQSTIAVSMIVRGQGMHGSSWFVERATDLERCLITGVRRWNEVSGPDLCLPQRGIHIKQPVTGLYASGVDAPKAYLSDGTVVGRHVASSKDGALSARKESASIELVVR